MNQRLRVAYDETRPTPVTWGLLLACYLVTIPSLIDPRLYRIFGGIEPRSYPWQLFTAVFEHGWPGFHGSIHLALNTFLILECGRPCERLLGPARFAILSIASAIANAGVQSLAEGVNGSSLVIWSWGPPILFAMAHARKIDSDVSGESSWSRLVGVLTIMYLGVTLLMPLIPYALGWRGNPIYALVMANIYHFTATVVGIGGTIFFAKRLRVTIGGDAR